MKLSRLLMSRTLVSLIRPTTPLRGSGSGGGAAGFFAG